MTAEALGLVLFQKAETAACLGALSNLIVKDLSVVAEAAACAGVLSDLIVLYSKASEVTAEIRSFGLYNYVSKCSLYVLQ